MEAVGLLMLTMQQDNRNIPVGWKHILQKMSQYMADCQGDYGETMVFGDDDAGKILDLEGIGSRESTHRNHYNYVLQMMSLLLPERYVEKLTDATLVRIASKEEIESSVEKPCYARRENVCYEDGGVSLLRSQDKRVFIGIDHGDLGFGSIAAHGHADALSFQMFLEGTPIFADAGTYIYHIDLENRNAFRKTENHNTVTVNGKNQSEMLGAFLWGKRAKTTLLWHNLSVGSTEENDVFYLEAEHDGYAPIIHKRKFVFNGRELKIYDSLMQVQKEISYEIHFLLGKDVSVCQSEASKSICIRLADGSKVQMQTSFSDETLQMSSMKKEDLPMAELKKGWISEEYGKKEPTEQLCLSGKTSQDITVVTTIAWENK